MRRIGLADLDRIPRSKHQLDITMKDLDIKPAKTKFWEQLAHYDKRLISVAASDNKVKAASKKQVDNSKSKEVVDDDTEEDDENDDEVDQAAASRPAPKQRRRGEDQLEEVVEIDAGDREDEPEAEAEDGAVSEHDGDENVVDLEGQSGGEADEIERPATAGSKRGREEDHEVDEEEEGQDENDEILGAEEEIDTAQDRPIKRTRRE
jgi:hypothetical protein